MRRLWYRFCFRGNLSLVTSAATGSSIFQRAANPFTLCLSDGRKLAVAHPEFVAVGRRVVVVIGHDDLINTVDPVHIVSIEEKAAET